MRKNAKQTAKAEWEVKLQQEAFARKTRTGETLGQAYEVIAKERGFKTYAALRAAMKDAQ